MAAVFLKRLTLQIIKTEKNYTRRCFGKYIMQKTVPAPLSLIASAPRLSYLIRAKAFSTVEDTQDERKKKKKNETAFSNIGRKINERIIHVLDEKGNDLGNMHRANVIRLMDERDLRLVRRNPGTEPPQYQLMTGIQIHEERLRLRESGKARPTPGGYFAVCSLRTARPQLNPAFAKVPGDSGEVKNWKIHGFISVSSVFFSSLPYFHSFFLFSLMPCVHHLLL